MLRPTCPNILYNVTFLLSTVCSYIPTYCFRFLKSPIFCTIYFVTALWSRLNTSCVTYKPANKTSSLYKSHTQSELEQAVELMASVFVWIFWQNVGKMSEPGSRWLITPRLNCATHPTSLHILAGEHANNHSCRISINHVQIIRPSLAHKNYDCHSCNSTARHNG